MTITRLAEPLLALVLASDLGVGLQLGHSARTTYLAMRLARHLGSSDSEQSDVYYTGLLRNVGCVADAQAITSVTRSSDLAFKGAAWYVDFGDLRQTMGFYLEHAGTAAPALLRPLAVVEALGARQRVLQGLREQCEVGSLVARRMSLGRGVADALLAAWDRWDGKGVNGQAGKAIPLPMRVVAVCSVAEVFFTRFGPEAALARIAAQSSAALDPELAKAFVDLARSASVWRELDDDGLPEAILALEPPPLRIPLAENGVDELATAFGDLAGLKSSWTVGHGRGVATLVAGAARRSRLGQDEMTIAIRSAHLADLGRVAIPNTILDKSGSLSANDWEHVRLHAHYGERILARSSLLAPLAAVVGAHHERIDGSGYHRGVRGAALPAVARLLAVADVAHALRSERPNRRALPPDAVGRRLRQAASEGRLDPTYVSAVCDELLQNPSHPRRASSQLTPREVDVVRLLGRGGSNKELAGQLGVSPKTVGRHLEHIYAKLEVTTRAGAVMAALGKGLFA